MESWAWVVGSVIEDAGKGDSCVGVRCVGRAIGVVVGQGLGLTVQFGAEACNRLCNAVEHHSIATKQSGPEITAPPA